MASGKLKHLSKFKSRNNSFCLTISKSVMSEKQDSTTNDNDNDPAQSDAAVDSGEPWWLQPTKGPGENCGYLVKRLKDLPKLHKAVWKDELQRVKTVLSTLKKTMYMDYFDKEHRTALHFACARGDDGMVRAICGAGANPNIPDSHGATPMHKAVESGNCFSLQHLLENGGDPNLADELGRTPLHIAAKTRDMASALLLLEKGASKGAAEKDGLTVLHLATLNDDYDMVRLIITTDETNNNDLQTKYDIISDHETSNHAALISPSPHSTSSVIITERSDLSCANVEDALFTDGELSVQKCKSKSSVDSEFLVLFDTDDEDTASMVSVPTDSDEDEDEDEGVEGVENTSFTCKGTLSECDDENKQKHIPSIYCHDLEKSQSISAQPLDTQEGITRSTPKCLSPLNDQPCPAHKHKDIFIKFDNPVISNEEQPEVEDELEESIEDVVKKISLLNSFTSLVADALEVSKQHQVPNLHGNHPLYESYQPVIIPWGDVALYFLHVATRTPTIPYLHSLMGMTIALGWVDPTEITPTDPDDPSMINIVTVTSPSIKLVGLGVVRGIDSVQKVFYISSPECLSAHALSRVNTIALGNPEYPLFYFPQIQTAHAPTCSHKANELSSQQTATPTHDQFFQQPLQQTATPTNCQPLQQTTIPTNCQPLQQTTIPTNCQPLQQTTIPTNCQPLQQTTIPTNCQPLQQTTIPTNCQPLHQTTIPTNCQPLQQTVTPTNCQPLQQSVMHTNHPPFQQRVKPTNQQQKVSLATHQPIQQTVPNAMYQPTDKCMPMQQLLLPPLFPPPLSTKHHNMQYHVLPRTLLLQPPHQPVAPKTQHTRVLRQPVTHTSHHVPVMSTHHPMVHVPRPVNTLALPQYRHAHSPQRPPRFRQHPWFIQ